MSKSILFLCFVALLTSCTKKEEVVQPVAPESNANKICPAKEFCPQFISSIAECQADMKSAGCDKMIEAFEKLIDRWDCQRSFDTGPVPAVWLCDEMVDKFYGYPRPHEKAVGIISKLTSKNGKKFFASDEIRSTMDGAVAEEFRALSLKASEKN